MSGPFSRLGSRYLALDRFCSWGQDLYLFFISWCPAGYECSIKPDTNTYTGIFIRNFVFLLSFIRHLFDWSVYPAILQKKGEFYGSLPTTSHLYLVCSTSVCYTMRRERSSVVNCPKCQCEVWGFETGVASIDISAAIDISVILSLSLSLYIYIYIYIYISKSGNFFVEIK